MDIPSNVKQISGEFNQSLRVVAFDVGWNTPFVLSARTCNFDPLPLTARPIVDHPPNAYSVALSVTAGRTYCAQVPGAVTSGKVLMKIDVSDSKRASMSLNYGFLATSGPIPIRVEDRIISIDPSEPNYARFLHSFSFKNWPNHLFIFDDKNDVITWLIGWHNFEFVSCTNQGVAQVSQTERALPPKYSIDYRDDEAHPPCRTPTGKFCAKHEKLASISIEMPSVCTQTGKAIMDIKLALFSFPWSWSSYLIPFDYNGVNLKINRGNEGIRALTKVVTGKEVPLFVHLVHNVGKHALELTLHDTNTIVFRNC